LGARALRLADGGPCAAGRVAASVIVAEIFRRALDEAGSEEADGYRYGGHGCRATAHHVLEFVEEIGEGALADRFRQLLQAFGGAVDDGADVGALVEGSGGLAQGIRELVGVLAAKPRAAPGASAE